MRKIILAGAAGLLALMALATPADAHPWGYRGYGGYGYRYGYAAPAVRFSVPAPIVTVNPYPYSYYAPYYSPRVRVYHRPYWHRWHRW